MTGRRSRLGLIVAACGVLTIACGHSKESNAMTTAGPDHGGSSAGQPSASRLPPPDVAAVTLGGLRYAQVAGKVSTEGQVGGILAAYDAGGTLLWTLKVYDNVRRDDLEGDVQDVFFRSMTAEPDGQLRIVNEAGKAFLVDVKTRHVTEVAGDPPRPDAGGLMPPPH